VSDSHRDRITILRNRKRGQPAPFSGSCATVAMIRPFDVQPHCNEWVAALVHRPSMGLTPAFPTLLNGISSRREVVAGQETI
jgi:hypothetical protein